MNRSARTIETSGETSGLQNRWAVLAYGTLAYLLFHATFLYAIGFVEGLFVPKHIDSGAVSSPGAAIGIDVALMGLFGLQHSVMARRGFKQRWRRIVGRPIERSTYVIATVAVMGLMFWQWRPIPEVVWSVQDGTLATAMRVLSLLGFGTVVFTTFLIDHFELFGLKQVLRHFRSTQHSSPQFQVRSMYKVSRHPLYLGFFVAFWCAPTMTVGHLLFSAVVSAYVLVAIQLEERDLIHEHGDLYREYRGRVPMLVPLPGKVYETRKPAVAVDAA